MKNVFCDKCKKEIVWTGKEKDYSRCPYCGNYIIMHAKTRIKEIADSEIFYEWDEAVKRANPFGDKEYAEKLALSSSKYKLREAVVTGEIKINGIKTAIGVMDSRFMMASMGRVVGEKVTRLFERATKKKLPVIMFCCSGGARMQEGIYSLMQMAKTSAAVEAHNRQGNLYISVLTNPTMGGVTSSFAMQADIVLAEKGAMIGFAGKRVIEQNTHVKLPEGFQTSAFQVEHGLIDAEVYREDLKEYLYKLLKMHSLAPQKKAKVKVSKPKMPVIKSKGEYVPEIIDGWEVIQKARSAQRPSSLDYIKGLFDDFIELHGDRSMGDDHAIVGGIATIGETTFTVVGIQKGKKDVKEAIYRNWGMPSPAGYRKALRLIRQADKFGRPIVCFVDTIGAACGIEAEEHGQGFAIANMLKNLSAVSSPVLSIFHGEGGSGGALALGFANEVWILENAVYSILSPEGFASIIWKDNEKATEAARVMKLTSTDLYRLKIVDRVYKEPVDLTTSNMGKLCTKLRDDIQEFALSNLCKDKKAIVDQRYKRFREY